MSLEPVEKKEIPDTSNQIAELKKIYLESDSKSGKAVVSTWGATVLSWTVNEKERLFLSNTANEDSPKAGKGIRGGIPVVFPNFGPWDLGPQHGFARYKLWKIATQCDRSVTFELGNDDETEKMWNHKFKLLYTVKVTDNKLLATLSVKNNNAEEGFDFTTLLHTYLRVPDIESCTIKGLNNTAVTDSLTNTHSQGHANDIAGLHENVDKNYKNTPLEHQLCFNDDGNDVTIEIRKSDTLPDTVLWNPWIEKAKAMGDFQDDGYKYMVCIEAGHVANRVILKAGETWQCEHVLEECRPVVEMGDTDDEQ